MLGRCFSSRWDLNSFSLILRIKISFELFRFIFYTQCDEEAASIVTAVAGARHWDWILKGYGVDGTEVKLRRSVATLEEQALPLTPQQIAPLPKALDISTVEIQLTEARSDEVARM